MHHHPRRFLGLFGISLLAFTAFLDVTIVSTALPFICTTFSATVVELQWINNAYSMALSMTMLAVGRLADLWGRAKVFYWGVAVFVGAAVIAGFSVNINMLIILRALQGLGGSILFVATPSLIFDAFPKHEHARAIGIYSAITGLGLALGPFAGGMLIEWLDWRWVFWINLPLIVFGTFFALAGLKLAAHLKPNTKIDWSGLSFLIPGLASFIYGTVNISTDFNSAWVWAFLGLGITLLVAFFLYERKNRAPLLDLTIFKDPFITLAALSCSLAGIVSFVFMFFDPLYLKLIRQLSALDIGLMIGIIPAAQVLISLFFDPLVRRFGLVRLMIISIITAFLAIASHGFIGESSSFVFIALPFALLGINWGLSNAGSIALVNERMRADKIASAVGSVFMVWNMVGSVFLAISTTLFDSRTTFLKGFQTVVIFNALFALVVALYALSLEVFGKKKL